MICMSIMYALINRFNGFLYYVSYSLVSDCGNQFSVCLNFLSSRFPCRFSILAKLEFGDVGFVEGGKPKNLKKTLRARHEPTTNSTHIWHWVGIKPRPHWWEASALTTVPSQTLIHYISRDSISGFVRKTICFQNFMNYVTRKLSYRWSNKDGKIDLTATQFTFPVLHFSAF